MNFEILKSEISERIATVTISRPAALNALNTKFFGEMNRLLDELEIMDDVRVIILTGEGKAFVAGADIAEMSGMTPEQALVFSTTGQDVFRRVETFRKPVIAAVNGFALGGGCELAMACDFRIASKLAKFGQPEMNLGLVPGYAGTQRLSRLCGPGQALYMILTAEMITAEDALRAGLVQKVSEPENLMTDARNLALKMASNGSLAVVKAKEIIRKGYEMDFCAGCRLEAEEFAALFGTDATKEGMKAFLEKRKPDW